MIFAFFKDKRFPNICFNTGKNEIADKFMSKMYPGMEYTLYLDPIISPGDNDVATVFPEGDSSYGLIIHKHPGKG